MELNARQLGGLIQVQAPLYPGDSGAAVVDLRGYWLGLIRGGLAVPGSGPAAEPEPDSTARTSPSPPRANAVEADEAPATAASGRPDSDTDFGFAIPTRDALWIAGQLSTRGQVDRAYLGVRLDTEGAGAGSVATSGPASAWRSHPVAGTKAGASDPDIASPTTHPGEPDGAPSPAAAGDGARVLDVVAGTPAASAGLRSGDLIVALEGHPIRSHLDLQDRLDRIPARMRIKLSVVRHRASQHSQTELTLQTASRPGPAQAVGGPAPTPPETVGARSGVAVTPTASQAPTTPAAGNPPTPAPSEPGVSASPDSTPESGPARPSQPTDPDRTTSDRNRPATPNPSASLTELRHTLPRAVVERFEKLERRLEKLETFSAPAGSASRAGPTSTPGRPGDSIRLP